MIDRSDGLIFNGYDDKEEEDSLVVETKCVVKEVLCFAYLSGRSRRNCVDEHLEISSARPVDL